MSEKSKYISYKYFIYSMLEYFKNEEFKLEQRNFGSIRQLLNDYIDISNQIKSNAGDINKLGNSLTALEDDIKFYLKNTTLSKHKFLKKDIAKVRSMLDIKRENLTNDKYFSLTAFVKKMNNINILDIWIDILLESFTKSFDDIDKLMDCYVSELLFEGYSLQYLEEFWLKEFKNLKECKDEESILLEVEKFRNLSEIKDNKYDILINLNLPLKLREELKTDESLDINKLVYKPLKIVGEREHLINNIKENSFFKSTKAFTLNIKIKAPDKYRAMYIATNNIVSYLEVYKVIDNSINKSIKVAVLEEDEEFYKEYKVNDFIKYSRALSNREKDDIVDFIELRDYFRKNNIDSKSIDDIENIINILQKLNELTIDNRLLNCWNSVESITRFYKDGKSNIDTVNHIIPKVISMYVIKQKMNCLWDRIYPLIKKGILKDERLDACISKNDNTRYNKSEFSMYLLMDETSNWLCENTISNVVIFRKIKELNKLLKDPKTLEKDITFNISCIKNNINSIYRLRNSLVHNGGSVNINLENYTQSLQYYLNCILGTLIHHMKRNTDLSIAEVLYSIISSYDEYMLNISMLKNKVNNLESKEKEDKIIEYGIENIAFINYLYI